MPARFRKRLERWTKKHDPVSICRRNIAPADPPDALFVGSRCAWSLKKSLYGSPVSARFLRYGLIAWGAAIYGRIVILWWTKNLADWSSAILWTFIGLLVSGIVYGIWQYLRPL
jgi:hypothetical protein